MFRRVSVLQNVRRPSTTSAASKTLQPSPASLKRRGTGAAAAGSMQDDDARRVCCKLAQQAQCDHKAAASCGTPAGRRRPARTHDDGRQSRLHLPISSLSPQGHAPPEQLLLYMIAVPATRLQHVRQQRLTANASRRAGHRGCLLVAAAAFAGRASASKRSWVLAVVLFCSAHSCLLLLTQRRVTRSARLPSWSKAWWRPVRRRRRSDDVAAADSDVPPLRPWLVVTRGEKFAAVVVPRGKIGGKGSQPTVCRASRRPDLHISARGSSTRT